jgi:hypothetical protein
LLFGTESGTLFCLMPLVMPRRSVWLLRANTQQMAIYAAGLLYNAGVPHQDTVRERPVIKVVRQGKILLALPDEHTVDLCEKQIARQREHPYEPRPPFWAE